MIKNIIFLIGLLMMCNIQIGHAQNVDKLKTSLELLQQPREFQFPIDSTGFSNVTTFKFLLSNGEALPFPIDPKNSHVVDFNNDGQNDIIYQHTFRYGATLLFVNKDNSFVELWSGAGALVEVKPGVNPTIYVRNNPIGCFNNTQLMALTVHDDNTITENFIAYHDATEIKDLDTDFKQQTVSGILRTQPVVDNEERIDVCTGESIIGNHVRIIDNTKVTVLKKHKDWLLVMCKYKDINSIAWIKN